MATIASSACFSGDLGVIHTSLSQPELKSNKSENQSRGMEIRFEI